MLHFFNDIVNDAESTQKLIIMSIIASLKSEPTCKLIHKIPGSRLFISRLPGLFKKRMLNGLGKHRNSTSVLVALPGNLDIKRLSHGILFVLSKEQV